MRPFLFDRLSRVLVVSVSLAIPAFTQVNILTNRIDNGRTAANTAETILNTTNVNVTQFGKLGTIPVDGAIFAQPLYVSGIRINGAKRNALYVATMNDKLYAIDASNDAVLWTVDFTNPAAGVTAIPITDIVGSNSLNIIGNVGVESTPVIDMSTKTMYLVVRTLENGTYVQRLHALDIRTGAEKFGGPTAIEASVTGTGYDARSGTVTFDPKMHNQRSSLALTNGMILIAWGSHEDHNYYHGWVMAYSAATLQQLDVFCTTPDGNKGGIWQGSRAPVIDPSGNIYYETGNGDWNGTRDFGDTVVKFNPGGSALQVLDYFTPYDYSHLESSDLDLGSTGSLLIPNTNVLVSGGKEGILYLIDLASMGHEMAGNTQILQSISLSAGALKPGPAYWNSPAGGLVYIWPQFGALKAYHFNGLTLDTPAYAIGSVLSAGSPGGSLSISANGSNRGSGIVWAELSTNTNDDHGLAAGTVRAYNAETLQELWNSDQNSSRDGLGTLVKFVPPVVANGKMFAVTYDNALAVYGLIPVPDFTFSATPHVQTIARGGTANYTVTVGAENGFAGSVNLSVSGLPANASATFSPTSVTGAGSATLSVSTTSATPLGLNTLSISAVSGANTHTAAATLRVQRR